MTEPTPTPPEEPLEPQRQTTPFLVLQFFIFPMAIVAVCVTVFVVFGLIAGKGKTPRDSLREIRTGGGSLNFNSRWQAAFELSKVLQGDEEFRRNDPTFIDEALLVFDQAKRDDPRVRRYLAVALGRLGDRKAVPALIEAVREEKDEETRIYALWSLGVLGDTSALPVILPFTESEDAGLRKTAIHALGGLDHPDSLAALLAALNDASTDVRWNAALALSRRRDVRAAPTLHQMLDRTQLTSVEDPGQREEILIQAIHAAAVVPDPTLAPVLQRLQKDDPSLRVREAAASALEQIRHPQQP